MCIRDRGRPRAHYDSDTVGTPQMTSSTPTDVLDLVVLLGGVDPSGGAGLVRDVLTASARGARAIVVGTAWTEQTPGAHRVDARAADDVLAALRQAIAAGPAAVKIGMIPDAPCAAAIVEALGSYGGPIVAD